uniref:Putative secreted peptide n=1 Tax=Anopheles braziliensis TaxID=58242 RepID=A0A2M3ZPV9_9DIPT
MLLMLRLVLVLVVCRRRWCCGRRHHTPIDIVPTVDGRITKVLLETLLDGTLVEAAALIIILVLRSDGMPLLLLLVYHRPSPILLLSNALTGGRGGSTRCQHRVPKQLPLLSSFLFLLVGGLVQQHRLDGVPVDEHIVTATRGRSREECTRIGIVEVSDPGTEIYATLLIDMAQGSRFRVTATTVRFRQLPVGRKAKQITVTTGGTPGRRHTR